MNQPRTGRALLARLAVSLVTFWVIVTAVFFLLRLAPGGPFDGERQLPPEVEENLRAAYHLDEPLVVQYGRYLGMLARGYIHTKAAARLYCQTDAK